MCETSTLDKNIMKLFPQIVAFILLVSGCATKTFLPQKSLSKDYGSVTVIRKYAEPTAFNIYVFLDGTKAASISNRSHATFSVPVGEHLLKFDWPKTASSTEFETKIDITGYSEHYFYVSQDIELSDFNFVIGYISYNVSEKLYVAKITSDQAKEILSQVKKK
jgi:hypothetical protein